MNAREQARVWALQCLCPQRHAIMGALRVCEGRDDADGFLAEVRKRLETEIATFTINPWCGICGADQAEWRYEVTETEATTLGQSFERLFRESEAKQAITRRLFGRYNPIGTKH